MSIVSELLNSNRQNLPITRVDLITDVYIWVQANLAKSALAHSYTRRDFIFSRWLVKSSVRPAGRCSFPSRPRMRYRSWRWNRKSFTKLTNWRGQNWNPRAAEANVANPPNSTWYLDVVNVWRIQSSRKCNGIRHHGSRQSDSQAGASAKVWLRL